MTRISPEPLPPPFHKVMIPVEDLATTLLDSHSPSTAITLLCLAELRRALDEHQAEAMVISELLSPAEAQHFQKFKYQKRRLEWLGGRLAVKFCLALLLQQTGSAPLSYHDCTILPQPSGRPWLEIPLLANHLPVPSVSISHCSDYAAALAYSGPACGIDIQEQTAQLFSVQERFTSDAEIALLQEIPEPVTRLAIIWVIKEAVKKCAFADSSLYFGAIQLVAFQGTSGKALAMTRYQTVDAAPVLIPVQIAQFKNYLVACVTGEHRA